jgi:hypothetical protein
MRDEDLKALPQSIDRHRFSELMQAVGFKAGWENHTRDLTIDRDGLHVVVYATDADGNRYFTHTPTEIEVTELGEKEPTTVRGADRAEAAVHEISIPFSGWWTAEPSCACDWPEGYPVDRIRKRGEHHSKGCPSYVEGLVHPI